MSMLTDFIASAATKAASVIGTETVAISGGASISAILNETDTSREYLEIGHDIGMTLTAIIQLSTWRAAYPEAAKDYLGKIAVARGLSLRVTGVNIGAAFVRLTLSDPGKS